jgi:hypothetical protein
LAGQEVAVQGPVLELAAEAVSVPVAEARVEVPVQAQASFRRKQISNLLPKKGTIRHTIFS